MLVASPQRAHSSSPTIIGTNGNGQPLALISSANNHLTISDQLVTSSSPAALKISSVLPNGLTTKSNGMKNAHNSGHIAINFTTAEGISPALLTATSAAMPLNLNVNAVQQQANGNGLHIIGNGNTMVNGKNGMRKAIDVNEHGALISKEQIKMESISAKGDSEPPTKLIKLINGGTIALASMDKEHKLIPSGQLTLSQVVVSQIPLLASSQGLRVIGQAPNGLATIELGNPNGRFFLLRCCFWYSFIPFADPTSNISSPFITRNKKYSKLTDSLS